MNDNLNVENETTLQKFYHGKRLFITGITGFFGKAIIEKLLRVTQVKHFYLLVREKKGKSIEERIDELFKDPIFNKVKELNVNYREKITVISGDCSMSNLGISQSDRKLLIENVDIVIHSAATVRFEERLKVAIDINVRGTYELLQLAEKFKNLKVLVYVSTVFSNCNHKNIEEKFYDCTISGNHAITLSNSINEDHLDFLTPKLLDDYPNTYTYTKCLAEDVVKSFSGKVPAIVFRPAIIMPSYEEPIAGWIDNFYGPLGISVAVGVGICRVMPINKDVTSHLVPVDFCVNSLLASAASYVQTEKKSISIYNYTVHEDNSIRWLDFVEYGLTVMRTHPFGKGLWYPTCQLVYHNWQFVILSFFYHLIFATILDTTLTIIGKKPKITKFYRNLHNVFPTLKYFMYNNLKININNTMEIYKQLEPADKELFNSNMKAIDWTKLVESGAFGLTVYMLKNDPKIEPQHVKHYKRLRALHFATLFMFFCAFVYFLCKVMQSWLLRF